jgi:hypothetical protein
MLRPRQAIDPISYMPMAHQIQELHQKTCECGERGPPLPQYSDYARCRVTTQEIVHDLFSWPELSRTPHGPRLDKPHRSNLVARDRTAGARESKSAQIGLERNAYYHMLEQTQKGGLDVTPWLGWSLDCLDRAFDGAEQSLAAILAKARFWDAHVGFAFNDRQRAMINRLLDGFVGKLTSSKWAAIAKCSQDTALRDIDDLVRRGVLVREKGGGRSTSYALVRG